MPLCNNTNAAERWAKFAEREFPSLDLRPGTVARALMEMAAAEGETIRECVFQPIATSSLEHRIAAELLTKPELPKELPRPTMWDRLRSEDLV